MKFVLKVFVLVCLVVLSKLSKDEAKALQKPVAKKVSPEAIFTSQAQRAPLAERTRSAVSVKFEKGSLQIN